MESKAVFLNHGSCGLPKLRGLMGQGLEVLQACYQREVGRCGWVDGWL